MARSLLHDVARQAVLLGSPDPTPRVLVVEAVAARNLVDEAYTAATGRAGRGYLWHEVGDSLLLLPRGLLRGTGTGNEHP